MKKPTLAALEDLLTLMGRQAPSRELELALRRASDAFADAVGHPVVEHTATRVIRGNGGPELLLPARPVSAASVDGVLVADENIDSHLGILYRPSGWPRRVLVTYTAGYPADAIPGAIQDAVLQRASHLAESTGLVQQEMAGSTQVMYSKEATVGVTQRWADTVAHYRVGVGDRS